MENRIWRGLGVSAGRAAGPIWYLKEFQVNTGETAGVCSAEEETVRLEQAVVRTEQTLTNLAERVRVEQGEEVAQIFVAHKLLLSDPSFIGEAKQRLLKGELSAEKALQDVAAEAVQMLRSLEDPYFQERAVDVQDVLIQLLKNLQDVQEAASDLFPPTGDYVVLADELTPAQTIALPKERVVGFIVRRGGKTSHAAILARTYGIPALVGVSEGWEDVISQKWIELDGEEGWARPSAEGNITFADTGLKDEDITAQNTSLDGIVLAANIGSPADLPLVQKFKAQGIGLYRTEFLFMGEELPSEAEQIEAYRQVITVGIKRPPPSTFRRRKIPF
jgi:phosphoenolpyruvate-protein phosphotransferase (PTS system enzyme I)